MEKIICTGAFQLPDLDAAAKRVLAIGKSIQTEDRQVLYLGWEEGDIGEKKHDDFIYYSMSEFKKSKNVIIRKVYGLFRGSKTIRWLLQHKDFLKDTHAFILYNPPAIFVLFMMFLSKLYKFKIILDSTEWYEASHLPGGKYGFIAIENYFRMKVVYPRIKNIICTSIFLADYYKKKDRDKKILLIPAIAEGIESRGMSKEDNNISKIILMYAGNLGRKDSLSEIVRILPILNRVLKKNIELHIYGPDYAELEKYIAPNILEGSKKQLRVFGKVSQADVLCAYRKADFSILYRENKRYALAGFPSKAIESWSCGVPLITNAIGDLQKYCNNDNSLVAQESDLEAKLQICFRDYDAKSKKRFQEGSLNTFNQYFSTQFYEEPLIKFLEDLR